MKTISTTVTGLTILGLLGVGCENLPGGGREQGAVIGGVSGAGAGALVGGEDNRLVGALIGGVLGAGGGYLVGQRLDKDDGEEAREAAERARQNPATVEEVRDSDTADINGDGFVSIDELTAMDDAELSDQEMINRLEATGQVFSLSEQQEQQLTSDGISPTVIQAMRTLNRESVDRSQRISDGPARR